VKQEITVRRLCLAVAMAAAIPAVAVPLLACVAAIAAPAALIAGIAAISIPAQDNRDGHGGGGH
jgi:hypothetical protein